MKKWLKKHREERERKRKEKEDKLRLFDEITSGEL
jgi:hypothetical protein